MRPIVAFAPFLAAGAALVEAAPEPANWFLAPTTTTTTAAPRRTTFRDRQSAASTSSAAAAASASSSTAALVFTGHFWSRGYVQAPPKPTSKYPSIRPPPIGKWVDYPHSACADEDASSTTGVWLSEAFYNSHGGLQRFCGTTIHLVNPANGLSVDYTVTAGVSSEYASDGVAGGFLGPEVDLKLGDDHKIEFSFPDLKL
ncbi:hypothetical protein JCM8097_008225 [Rhodosporidiobolus ruineniae]